MSIKILKRLLPYAKPIRHFLPEYLIYTFVGIIFGLLNIVLLIPILDTIINKDITQTAIPALEKFTFSLGYFKSLFQHKYYSIIVHHGKFNALLFVCCIVALSIIISNIFKYLAVKTLIRVRLKLMTAVRAKLFETYLQQSLSYHHNTTKGELLMLLTGEVQEIEGSIINSIQVALRDPFMVIANFTVLFFISPQLTIFSILFLPISGYIITIITKQLKKLSYFSQDHMSTLMSYTSEVISGIRQIQIFNAQKMAKNKFDETNDAYAMNSRKLFAKKELASPISEILGVFTLLILILYAGHLILNGKSTLSGVEFIGYLSLYSQMIQPLKNISQISGNLQRGLAACERIFKVIDAEPEIKDKAAAIELDNFNEKIEFKNVSFGYEEKNVLNNINLSIDKGKSIAIVGSSGSGKSTLVDLICRFYDVREGSIAIDNKDIRNVTLRSLRNNISYVSQSTFLFNDTIANNISFGSKNNSKESIINAANISNSNTFIEQSANKYETIIGETGIKLSGGQRQRLTIARAVLKDSPILILDEATSSLDTESERLVQNAIEQMTKDKTCIIIAHRLSTIQNVDEIIVMDKGNIIERGNHSDLIAKNGVYKRLVDLQEIK